MNEEQDKVWDSLKYGVPSGTKTPVEFLANGRATKFHSAWFPDSFLFRVTVDDVAQSQFRDFKLIGSDIVFKHPPAAGLKVIVEVFD